MVSIQLKDKIPFDQFEEFLQPSLRNLNLINKYLIFFDPKIGIIKRTFD